ncbi:restriction endonuclease subunit S [Nostoc sp. C110]|uniref:restriction endonuclease subunit S n=1 Tax=Nostoc sp. C110 TaxID=3349876 RepID=UPI00370DAB6E
MSNWKVFNINEISLAESLEFVVDNRGKTVPLAETSEKIIALIATNCISNDHLYPQKLNLRYVSQEIFDNWFRAHPKSGDIILTNKGSNNGEVCLVPENIDFCIAQDMVAVRADKKKIDPLYLFAALRSKTVQRRIKYLNVDAVIPHFKKTDFNKLLIPLPERKYQEFIGELYFNLSSKIENLRRQNDTLEAIAQTLFKHWFIDFEFPNADGKPYKSSGGAMVRSALGYIPEAWSVGKLGQYLNIKHGYAFKGEYITTEVTEKILLTPVNFKIGGGFNDSKYKYYSADDYLNEYVLRRKDLAITMTDLSKEGDSLGYPAFIPDIKGKVFLHNQRIGKVENNNIDKTFLYFLLCRREYRSHILGTSSGSTVRHTSPSRICEYSFVIPDFELIDKFSALATATIDKILINFNQIQTLTKTRDAILPKLMSGQLRVDM